MNAGEVVYLLLGSNLGDRLANLATAQAALSTLLGAPMAVSSIYETAAWGVTDQPAFLNQVVAYTTTIAPATLLQHTQAIERVAGPPKTRHWGARHLDIDILLYGATTMATDQLTIPHPALPDRRFTLVPLVEIASTVVHPLIGLSMAALLAQTTDHLPVHKVAEYAS